MSMTPIENIKQAEKDNGDLATLFALYVGSKRKPKGRVVQLYRYGRRELAALRKDGKSIDAFLGMFALMLKQAAREAVDKSVELGRESASNQLETLGLAGLTYSTIQGKVFADTIEQAINLQVYGVKAAIRNNFTDAQLLGDGVRSGLFSPSPIQRVLSNNMAMAAAAAFLIDDQRLTKTAVAIIDIRTTDCCRRVNGQVRKVGEPFELTGTPRYADMAQSPPFHDYCRTSIALGMVRNGKATSEL